MAENFQPSFADLERDLERYAALHCERDDSGPTPIAYGYYEAERQVFGLYVEARAYDQLVHYLLTQRTYVQGLNDYFLEVSRLLLEKRQTARLTRLWRNAAAQQKQHFWELVALRDRLDVEDSLVRAKALALNTLRSFRDALATLGEVEACHRLDGEILQLEEERRPKPPGKPDPRAMTEDLFWELIETARKAGGSPDEQVAVLTESLAGFKASQIKAFEKLLFDVLARAYHFDLWALAFLVQDGCSDDAFEAFRAWLVLRGRQAFELALAEPARFLIEHPTTSHNAAEALLQAPAVAYEWRSGKALKPAKRRPIRIQGEAWLEEDLPARYPEVIAQLQAMRS
ncbi:MAG: DUF4240 domain-containing protein [Kiloniellales bacterium]|nr:DUF4240 domain-containing protein [Kiloniellales bacterium]